MIFEIFMTPDFSENESIGQRGGQDRRLSRWPSWKWFLFGGRRVHIRREEDRKQIRFLDRYPATIFGPAILIIFLSVLDAFLTVFLLNHGAVEVNPVMNFCLEKGPVFFIVIKYLFTSLAVVLLVVFNHTFLHNARINTRVIVPLVIGIFSAVIVWEIYLIIFHMTG